MAQRHATEPQTASYSLLAALFAVCVAMPCRGQAQTNGGRPDSYGANAQSNAFGVPTLPDTPAITQQPLLQSPLPSPPQQSPELQPPSQPFGGMPASPPMPYKAPPAPAPAPQPSRPAMSIQQYLVSLWHGQSADDTGSWDIYVTFNANGTFVQQQTLVTNQFHLALSGRYTVQLGPDGGTIVMSPQSWQPRQICSRPGRCQPVNMPLSVAVPFHLISHDTLATDKGIFQRVGPGH